MFSDGLEVQNVGSQDVHEPDHEQGPQGIQINPYHDVSPAAPHFPRSQKSESILWLSDNAPLLPAGFS
jgi:hypothetical protein